MTKAELVARIAKGDGLNKASIGGGLTRDHQQCARGSASR